MKSIIKSLLVVSVVSLTATVNAGMTASGFQTKGFIWSGEGKKCWYKQHEQKSGYFSNGGISGNIGVLTFDKSNCMSEDSMGLGHMLNKNMINGMVSNWYSHSDAKFKTEEKELYDSSLFQKKGKCMQSRTYEQIGITIDYFLGGDGGISTIYHGASVGECVNK